MSVFTWQNRRLSNVMGSFMVKLIPYTLVGRKMISLFMQDIYKGRTQKVTSTEVCKQGTESR